MSIPSIFKSDLWSVTDMRINKSYASFHTQLWLYQVSEKEADDYSILMWPLHTASLNRWKRALCENSILIILRFYKTSSKKFEI